MSHTPGPWSVSKFDYRAVVETSSGEELVVADIRNNDRDDSRLIAAAPDLLAALQMLMDYADDLRESDAFNEARAAVRKATGDAS